MGVRSRKLAVVPRARRDISTKDSASSVSDQHAPIARAHIYVFVLALRTYYPWLFTDVRCFVRVYFIVARHFLFVPQVAAYTEPQPVRADWIFSFGHELPAAPRIGTGGFTAVVDHPVHGLNFHCEFPHFVTIYIEVFFGLVLHTYRFVLPSPMLLVRKLSWVCSYWHSLCSDVVNHVLYVS